jgi:hypothetical protein
MSGKEASVATEPGDGAARCFVIGPIGDRLAAIGTEARKTYEEALEVFETVIRPACKAVRLDPIRSDGLARAGELTDQIFQQLRDADVVIADLTGANPNVMYELGLRHTREKLTLQVGEDGRLPFDINVIRTVMFTRSEHEMIIARNQLQKLLVNGLDGAWDPVSATRVWHHVALSEPVDRTPQDELDEDPPGFIDRLAEAETAQDRVSDTIESVSAQLQLMGELAEESTERMKQSEARGEGMRGRLAVVIKYAHDLDAVAGNLELHVADYLSLMNSVASGYSALIEVIEEDPEALTTSEAQEFAAAVRKAAQQTSTASASGEALVDTMVDNAQYARALRPPTKRITKALGEFHDAGKVFNIWDRRLEALGFPKPPDDEVDAREPA